MGKYAVYILASGKNGTLYTGVTGRFRKRIIEHKEKIVLGFTAKYGVDRLVYYELYNDIKEAIKREKQIKNLVRRKKVALIEKYNPGWDDLDPIAEFTPHKVAGLQDDN